MNKKYRLSRQRIKRRIKRIIITYSIRFGVGIGVVTGFNSFLNLMIPDKLEVEKLLEEDFSMDYSYLDLDSYEGVTILEKYINFKKEQNKYINQALEYFESEEYQKDLITNNVYYKLDNLKIEDEYNKIKDELVNTTYEEVVIKHYCDIYQVDYQKVYNKLSELTDNFSSDEYLNGYIPGITFKKEEAIFENKEALLLVAVRCCAQKPESVGLSNISTNIKYNSSYEPQQEIVYYSKVFGIDPKLSLGVFIAEGNATNNVGSIKINGEFASYENITKGVIEMVAELYKYNSRGFDTPETIQPIYAPLSDGELNSNWIKNVYGGMKMATNYLNEAEKMDYNFENYVNMNCNLRNR